MAVVLALALHLAFGGLLVLLEELDPTEPRKPVRPASAVAVRPLTADQWQRNRGQKAPSSQSSSTAQRPREEKKEEKKPEKRPEGQVVDVAPGNNQESPDAKYLAESNNTVQKETRAKEQTAHYRNAMPQRTAPQTSTGSGPETAQAPQTAGNNGLGMDDRPLSEAGKRMAMELPDARRRQEIALKDSKLPGPGLSVENRNESDEVVGNSKRLRIQPGLPGGEEEGSMGRLGGPGLATLMPSQAVMDRIVGAAPNDNLRELDEGDGTFLNTREWKYASFFNRVKQSVGLQWDPNQQLRRRDPTGQTYSGRDRVTLLTVVLDERGRLQDVQVEKSSGLDFLDMEAIASFQRAQPFPNPPPGLLDGDSRVKFQFGFFLEMGGGPQFRLFRQPN